MRGWASLFLAAVLLSVPTTSSGEAMGDVARAALDDLRAAHETLEAAHEARDRVQALTRAIKAYEAGLSALRETTRQATRQEAEITAGLAAREERTAALLIALQTFATRPAPVLLQHPAGPAGGARAGLLLADIAPRLDAEAADLRRDLERLNTLRALQQEAEATVTDALAQLLSARQDLGTALANRQPLPRRFTSDPVREAILIASTDTLAGFADGLDQLAGDIVAPAGKRFDAVAGDLPLPVRGSLVRAAGETDSNGITRPGVVVATAPRALVTSPADATLRYAGPLLDFGNVLILEPQIDVLFVFAGLDELFATTGEIVSAGSPLGLMGTGDQKNLLPPSIDGDEAGPGAADALYIEVRKKNLPEDPGLWFRTEQDG